MEERPWNSASYDAALFTLPCSLTFSFVFRPHTASAGIANYRQRHLQAYTALDGSHEGSIVLTDVECVARSVYGNRHRSDTLQLCVVLISNPASMPLAVPAFHADRCLQNEPLLLPRLSVNTFGQKLNLAYPLIQQAIHCTIMKKDRGVGHGPNPLLPGRRQPEL